MDKSEREYSNSVKIAETRLFISRIFSHFNPKNSKFLLILVRFSVIIIGYNYNRLEVCSFG